MKSKIKEPARLRSKKLENNNRSLYLDIYIDGKRKYEFLRLYLVPETSQEDKIRNKKTLALANAIKSQRIVDIQNKAHGFAKSNSHDHINFVEYLRSEIGRYTASGSIKYAKIIGCIIRHLIAYHGERTCFKDVDKSYLKGYVDYLNGANLARSTQYLYFKMVVVSLNRAVREGIIDRNPADNISREDCPSPARNMRVHLTFEELKLLMATPCRYDHIKRAFLFSCFCGLRFSDVQRISWDNIEYIKEGTAQLKIIQKKTSEPLYIPLSVNALEQLPAQTKDGIIFELPTLGTIEITLRKWARTAGINKHITFHIARHTYAVLLLSFGADLYTVSKLLGHTSIHTTQIYAQIADKKKTEAVNLIPSIH